MSSCGGIQERLAYGLSKGTAGRGSRDGPVGDSNAPEERERVCVQTGAGSSSPRREHRCAHSTDVPPVPVQALPVQVDSEDEESEQEEEVQVGVQVCLPFHCTHT